MSGRRRGDGKEKECRALEVRKRSTTQPAVMPTFAIPAYLSARALSLRRADSGAELTVEPRIAVRIRWRIRRILLSPRLRPPDPKVEGCRILASG